MTSQTIPTEYNLDNEPYDLRSIFTAMMKGGLDKRTRDNVGIFLANYMKENIQRHYQFVEYRELDAAYTKSQLNSLNEIGFAYLDNMFTDDEIDGLIVYLGNVKTGFAKRREMFNALLDLKSQGIIRSVGAGMNYCEPLIDFAKKVDLDCFLVAGRYTLLDQSASEELFPICLEKNISLILGGPYNSGILADPKLDSNSTYFYQKVTSDILVKARSINEICIRQNVPLKAAALQFGLMNPAVTSVIPGVRNVNEVIENFEMLSLDIEPQFWDELRFEGLI